MVAAVIKEFESKKAESVLAEILPRFDSIIKKQGSFIEVLCISIFSKPAAV